MVRTIIFMLMAGLIGMLACNEDDFIAEKPVPPASDTVPPGNDSIPGDDNNPPDTVSTPPPDDGGEEEEQDTLVLDIEPDNGYYVQNPVTKSFGKTISGFYEGLPPSYATSPEKKYPLFIYFVGTGERGNGTPEELVRLNDVMGPARLIHYRKFPSDFLVDGQYLSPIVISVQTRDWEVTAPIDIDSLVDYAVANYRVDKKRIYLTGLSMGGGAVWAYVALKSEYAQRIASIVTMGAKADPSRSRAQIIADANIHAWAFHNEQDDTVPSSLSIDYIQFLNDISPGLGRITLFQDTDHNCWKKGYLPEYEEEDGVNVYEWMLQFTR